MAKFQPETDQFKYFQTDPPEIKLEAWKQLQRRLTVRDLVACLPRLLSVIAAIVGILKFYVK